MNAPYDGGEMTTNLLMFSGNSLIVNFATSAAGSIKVGILDAAGKPVPGYAIDNAVETVGDDIARVVRWERGSDVGALAGKPVRLRFVMKDADLYAIRFE